MGNYRIAKINNEEKLTAGTLNSLTNTNFYYQAKP